MSEVEVGELLTVAALLERREITVEEVRVWHSLIGHMDMSVARQALQAHLQESPYPPKPADLLNRAKVARERHRERHGIHPAPPAGQRWAVDVIEQMADTTTRALT